MKILGIVLIVIGVLMMIFQGFSFTEEKKVVDAGPIQISRKENKSVGWPVYAGGIAVAAGIVVLVASRKKVL